MKLVRFRKETIVLDGFCKSNVTCVVFQASECSGLQHSVEELQRQLEMAQLYNQQLSSQSSAGQESLQIVEQLQKERDALNTQVQQVSKYCRCEIPGQQIRSKFDSFQNGNFLIPQQNPMILHSLESSRRDDFNLERRLLGGATCQILKV